MLLTTFFTAAALLSGVVAVPSSYPYTNPSYFAQGMTSKNHYNSPLAPWKKGSKPGWYYGSSPKSYPDLGCVTPGSDVCKQLSYNRYGYHCPVKPPVRCTTTAKTTSTVKTTTTVRTTVTTTDTVTQTVTITVPVTTTVPVTPPPSPTPTPVNGYFPTFSNITAAVQSDPDFQTFGLVDTVDECLAMCDSVAGCVFVNSYNDINGKGGSTQLTCSLFSQCHDASSADNRGGQGQPDGSVDFIINSDGFCKTGNTIVN